MAGRTGGNITEPFYGDRFSGAAGNEVENKKNDGYPTYWTNASMKCSSSLIRDTLRLSLFHGWIPASNSYAMRTVWVTWRMRELLSLWENDHAEFVSFERFIDRYF
jgi:hypothetical protein